MSFVDWLGTLRATRWSAKRRTWRNAPRTGAYRTRLMATTRDIEVLEPRCLLSAIQTGDLSGRTFRDVNGDGKGIGDPAFAGFTVYLDSNNNAQLDAVNGDTFTAIDTPVSLNAQGIALSTQTLSGLAGVITDLNVTLDLQLTGSGGGGGAAKLIQGNDVNVSQSASSQGEVHIAVNPTNPQNLVIVANGGTSDPSAEFLSNSFDGGATWNLQSLSFSQDGIGDSSSDRFDAAVAFDRFGNLHLTYMARDLFSGLSAIMYGFSSDGGNTLTTQVLAPLSPFVDKPWIATGPDAANPNNVAVYVTYLDIGGLTAEGAVVTGLGTVGAFSTPTVFSPIGNYAVPAVGPNGEFAVTWMKNPGGQNQTQILMDKDLNGLVGGLTFGVDTTVSNTNVGGFDYIPATPDRSTFASPYFAYDQSNGPFRGRLYCAYAEELPDESNNLSINVRSSNDNGTTWSAPITVNDNTGKSSAFFQSISVDPVTGHLFLSWYDTRNDLIPFSGTDTDFRKNTDVEVWGSASTNGGASFLPNIRISEGSSNQARDLFNPNDFGDYAGIAVYNDVAHATWVDNSNSTGDNPDGTGAFDVYTDRISLITSGATLIAPDGTRIALLRNFASIGQTFTNTTLDDQAAGDISTGSSPFTASFTPVEALSQLNGFDPNGDWSLEIQENSLGATATLNSWSLQIDHSEQNVVTDSSGQYAFLGLNPGAYHVRAITPTGFVLSDPTSGVYDEKLVGGDSVINLDFGACTPPQATIDQVTPSPRISPVGLLNINFDQPVRGVDLSDFKLTRNLTPVPLTGVTFHQDSVKKYSLDLTSVTTTGGVYVLSLPAAGSSIASFSGIAMTNTATSIWVVDLLGPIADVVDVAPDPRGSAVSSITVTFDEAAFGVDLSDFTLTRNGSAIPLPTSTVTVTKVNPQTYRIDGLDTVTAIDEGTYAFSLKGTGTGIADALGNLATAGASDRWVVDFSPPVADIVDITPDPRDTAVGIVTVNFNKFVTGVGISDFTLTRNGSAVPLTGVIVSPSSGPSNTYSMDLSGVTSTVGTYVLTLVALNSGIADDGGFAIINDVTDTWINKVNAPPTGLALSNSSVPENTPTPAAVGTVTFTDDGVQPVVLSVSGSDSSSFEIVNGNQLRFVLGTPLDFESGKTSYSITITAVDGALAPVNLSVIVSVTNVPEAPTDISLTGSTSIPENIIPVGAGGQTIGTLSATDPDATGMNNFSISTAADSTDAASFRVSGTNTLQFKPGVQLDFESKLSYQVRIVASDSSNSSLMFSKLFNFTLTNVNEAPVAGPDTISVLEGGTTQKLANGLNNVLANDSDPEQSTQTLTLTLKTGPSHAKFITGVQQFALNPNGTFRYTHDDTENYSDSFVYTLTDSLGLKTDGTVTINVTPVNDSTPTANPDFFTVNEAATLDTFPLGPTGVLTNNDTDQDMPDTLTLASITPVAAPTHGTLTLRTNGTFKYVHDGSETTSDSFQYLITDAATPGHTAVGTVNITIIGQPDPPTARPDSFVVNEGAAAPALNVLDNDSDPDTPNSGLTTTIVSGPLHAVLIGPSAFTLNPNGTFTYVHNGDEAPTDFFVYEVSDGTPGNTSRATVSITVNPVNDSVPVANLDQIKVQQGGSASVLVGGAVTLTKNDTDADLPFDTLSVDSTPTVAPSHGTVTLNADGSFTYKHNANDRTSSSDSFKYLLRDGASHTSEGTVGVQITLINQRPAANPGGAYTISPGASLTLHGENSSDPDAGDTATLTYAWYLKGSTTIDATGPTPTFTWDQLLSKGITAGSTNIPVRLEVKDSGGLAHSTSTVLSVGTVYEFQATGGVAEYIFTVNPLLDISKNGTSLTLPNGLTGITGVKVTGTADIESFTVPTPSRTFSYMIEGAASDTVNVKGTTAADTFTIASSNGRVIVQKTNAVTFYVSATAGTVVVRGDAGGDTLDARQLTIVPASLTSLQLFGEAGNDTLTGGLSNDTLDGGADKDLLSEVGPGNLTLTNTLLSGHGADTLTAIEAIKLTGDAGNNKLDASGFSLFGVTLDGAAGNDTLLGTSKADSLIGGDGTADEVQQIVSSGNATLSDTQLVLGTGVSAITDSLSGIEKTKLTGGTTPNKLDATSFTGSVTLDGGSGGATDNDSLFGGSGADLILGRDGNDSLLGNSGNDTISGGAGNDAIDGGDGNDGLAGLDGNDNIKGGAGNDTILGGLGNDTLRGGLGGDIIQGGQGLDNIDGEGGIDTVMGGSGGGADRGDKILDPFAEVNESFIFTVDWLDKI